MNPRVLFVDDDEKLLASVRRMLGRRYHVVTAAGADEALKVLKDSAHFAVVVSDLKMPGMDGIEFLGRVRDEHPNSVRMVLTGYANLHNAIDAVNNGYVYRFMTKPCPMGVLEKALSDGVDQHRLLSSQVELAALRRFKGSMEGIIQGFTSLVEVRDPYTAGHQRKVTELSTAIARELGLDEERISGLRMAALVHDIGKLYVPAEFLNRPGKLSDAEFSIIKTHPVVGRDILAPVDFPWPVADIVAQHHERMDGSGYPDGLSAKDIILEARILAVADVVDAITSHRPYRPGLGLEKALADIEDGACTIYDPDVVSACLGLFRDKGYILEMGTPTQGQRPLSAGD